MDVTFEVFLHFPEVAHGKVREEEHATENFKFSNTDIVALSDWTKPNTTSIRNRIFKGHFTSIQDVYDLRKTATSEQRDNSAPDVVVLPLDPSLERAKAGSNPAKRPIKLAVFDMDSTLIQQEVIDELARTIGKYEAVAAITERAMRGELDFAGSLRERVALLKGLPKTVWEDVKPRIAFTNGARILCRRLKEQGAKLAVLSGGFTPLAEWVKDELGLDVAHANFLETEAANQEFPFEHLSGKLVEGVPIVTAERKRELLLQLARDNNIPLHSTLCVGDGANDLEMLGVVGAGSGVAIAFNAKPRVQEAAPNKLNTDSLANILYLLGWNKADIESGGGGADTQ